MSRKAHAQAFLGLLAATDPTLTTLDGVVPTGQVPPYVLVYFHATIPNAEQAPDAVPLEGGSEVMVMSAYCHCVGDNAAAARTVADRVQAALLNKVPVIAGRVCHPIRHEDGQPPQRDESTGRLRMDQIDVYSFRSVPG